MADHSRIEALRRRVGRDPGSMAFAQLAEEYRRAGRTEEAVVCAEAGLAHHPRHASARVTLGRALETLGRAAEARSHLESVLADDPGHLVALASLASLLQREGVVVEALVYARRARALAGSDQALDRLVVDLAAHGSVVAAVTAPAGAPAVSQAPPAHALSDPELVRALRTIAALETWRDALHVTRTRRIA